MLRKLLLPILATAALAGCATGYQYRGGQGDYYYGQPQVEYRHSGPTGFYGDIGFGYGSGYGYGGTGYGFGGFEARYFYDRYGRLVYGYPGRYYRAPYYRHGGGYPHRPPRGQGDGDNQQVEDNTDRKDRPPPWRDLGQLQQRDSQADGYRGREYRERRMRSSQPASSLNSPIRAQRAPAAAPVIRERHESSSGGSGLTDGASRSRGNTERRDVD